ncbi:MAG TPA: spore maturation protein [Firmicutes bacterium]|nr:spore maturation protein [Bacillota bacterium]
MNIVFLFLVVTGIAVAAVTGQIDQIVGVAVGATEQAVSTMLDFVGIIVLWLGVARLAEEAGLLERVSRVLEIVLRPLFPEIPPGHPAYGSIMLNFTANLFGLGSAATPFGLKAMQQLQDLNPRPDTATNSMCTFLVINTSSVTLVPTTLIALRASAGSQDATQILPTVLFATAVSTLVAIILDWLIRKRRSPFQA